MLSPEMRDRILRDLDRRYAQIKRVEGIAFGVENLKHHFEPFKWFVKNAWEKEREKLTKEGFSSRDIRRLKKPEWEAMLVNELAKIEQEWRDSL